MNIYQHAFIFTIMVTCATYATGVWCMYERNPQATGKLVFSAFLFGIAAIIALGYIISSTIIFFLWLGTL